MRVRIVGQIVDAEPRIPARLARRRLILDRRGQKYLILDSGFTGSVAISEEWANRLELRYAGIQPFELANGQIVEFPTYLGFVSLGQREGLFEFVVTGEALLGLEFFERLTARIFMDCENGKVVIEGELTTSGLRDH
jgi:predicted aspartyl protease